MRQLNHATKLFLICSTFLVQIQSFGIDTRKAGDTIIHLNHAGASPSPPSVLDTVIQHMKLEQQLGGYAAARMRETELQQVYRNVARLVHAPSSQDIALVESATVAWTRLFYSMVVYQNLRREGKKIILLSEAEYAANVVAACQWARILHDDWTVLPIPSSKKDGIVDMQAFRDLLNDNIALVCVTHIPTNSGIINPVKDVGEAIAHYNANTQGNPRIFYLVDACQSIGQLEVNVQRIQCHGLTATGRKYLRAPRGTGFLYVNSTIDYLIPNHIDHYCAPITRVPSDYPPTNVEDWIDFSFREGAKRFEFWESNIAGKLGLGEAVRYAMDEVGMEYISNRCQALGMELIHQLQSINGVHVHHDSSSSCGIVTFSIHGVDAATVKEQLWTKQPEDNCQFEVSVVPATSTPLDSARCQVPDLVRASVSYTNSIDDIKAFCKRINIISIDPHLQL
jgi:selenocysteine lyase/cysteine desulfurase